MYKKKKISLKKWSNLRIAIKDLRFQRFVSVDNLGIVADDKV